MDRINHAAAFTSCGIRAKAFPGEINDVLEPEQDLTSRQKIIEMKVGQLREELVSIESVHDALYASLQFVLILLPVKSCRSRLESETEEMFTALREQKVKVEKVKCFLKWLSHEI